MTTSDSYMERTSIDDLIRRVLQCAYAVHDELCQGYLESVYKKALIIEMQEQGLKAKEEVPLNVYYKGVCVGEYYADIVVEDRLIVELKAVKAISPVHGVQLVNYLQSTGIDTGIIINFGQHPIGIQRKYRTLKQQ